MIVCIYRDRFWRKKNALFATFSLAWRLDREMRRRLILHETGFTFERLFYFLLYFICFWSDLVRVLATTGNSSTVAGYRVFSHDLTAAILVSTMKRRPSWCPKPILERWNLFMQTFSFVPINLHRCWPLEWKHSMLYTLYSIHENSRASIPEKLRHCQISKVIYMARRFNHRWK